MIAKSYALRISTCLYIPILILFVAVFTPHAVGAADRVPIPNPGQDQAPIITVSAVASGGSADIQYVAASSSICASPCKNGVRLRDKNGTADISLIINAENLKGGVKDVSVIVSQNGSKYNVSRSAAPNAQNVVPVSLPILGTNNKGGIGSNPILVHLNKNKPNATVLVEAGNYNGQRSIYAVTYYVPGKVTAKLSASKNKVFTDEETTLRWETRNAESIEIKPSQGLPQELPLNGSARVKPLSAPGTVEYTLTARNWLETATSSTTIKVDKRANAVRGLSLKLDFTCPSAQIYANATFEGRCDSECNPSTLNNTGTFRTPYAKNISCYNNSCGVSTSSPSNLTPGNWKVKVTPMIPTLNLTEQSPECAITIRAGESHTVIFNYLRDTQTGRWTATCRTQ